MGYLIHPSADPSGGAMGVAPYQPQPGDIILFNEFNRLYDFLFRLAHTSPPTHAGIVIQREDGSPALLDLLGPSVIGAHVAIVDIPPRLSTYPGVMMVRQVRQPLSQGQSAELTRFARAQVGKEFAAKRLALQVTPFRARTGLRRYCFGHTYLDRQRWICSELVVAAACAARILDADAYPANAIYPHDLAYDEWIDLSHRYSSPLPWSGDPGLIEQPVPGGPIQIPIAHCTD
jgi:hypothetical protein